MSITEELLALSRSMLASATAQEWDRVHDIETRRSRLLAGYRASNELHLGQEYVETSLREILAINQSVLELAVETQGQIADSLGALTRGVRANHAYRQNE